MRQGQQNRRGRGRNNNNNNNNNNRKSQNPLMRSFESSGPDVKIRGTPSHIAEKYITLARDALSSGDPVLAENYLQHAEHYNRIILGYREQMAQQGGADPMGMGNGAARTHSLAGPEGSDGDEFGDEEGDEFGVQQPLGGQGGGQPDLQQPFQQQPRNFDNTNQNRYENRPPRNDRYNNNRNDRGDGQRFDRNDRNDRGGDRQDFRGDRGDRYERNASGGGENRYRDDRRPHNNGGVDGNQGEAFTADFFAASHKITVRIARVALGFLTRVSPLLNLWLELQWVLSKKAMILPFYLTS